MSEYPARTSILPHAESLLASRPRGLEAGGWRLEAASAWSCPDRGSPARSLIGSYVSLVRVSEDAPPPLSEHVLQARLADDEEEEETSLEALMQHNVDDFIESHVLRFRLPSWFSNTIGNAGMGRDVDAVDVDLEDIVESEFATVAKCWLICVG